MPPEWPYVACVFALIVAFVAWLEWPSRRHPDRYAVVLRRIHRWRDHPPTYTKRVVELSARSFDEAGERALEAVGERGSMFPGYAVRSVILRK